MTVQKRDGVTAQLQGHASQAADKGIIGFHELRSCSVALLNVRNEVYI